MKRKLQIVLAAALGAILWTGCASFTTEQIDERTNAKTQETTKITTKATARTFFDAKSELARFKAAQTEKSQGAEVGSLSQSASSTNLNALVESVTKAAVKGAVEGATGKP